MVKFLQLVFVLAFLVFAMPQAFSQDQNRPNCSFCELKATGAEKCQKCLSSEKGKCPLPGNKSVCSDIGKRELHRRSGKWDDKSRIPGARSLNDRSTKDEVEKVIKTKDTLVITYCANLKCPASKSLYIHLKKLGYKNVLEYPFGIESWLETGNDIEMAE